jgi:hypothetical protein
MMNLRNVASALNNFLITTTGKLNIQQIEEADAISVLKDCYLETSLR